MLSGYVERATCERMETHMSKKPEGPDKFNMKVATGAKEPRTTNVDDEVKAMGFDTSKHVSGPNSNQGGN